MSDQSFLPDQPGAGTRPRAVLDTDTYNEIDDQFALAYLMRASDKVDTEAIYAAPYVGRGAATAGDGMKLSFDEIGRLLERLGQSDFPAFRGSERFLSPSAGGPSPVESPAAADLVDRAMSATHSDRLTIIAIGALTNVASALLLSPEIAERCTVVWLGGHHPNWPDNAEFNLAGDISATRAVFDSGVPLYVVPCFGVASHMLTSAHELEHFLDLASPLSRFLYDRYREYGPADGVWTKEIWDIAAVAWMVLPESVKSYQLATPRIAQDGSYVHDPRRHLCRFAYQLDRDAIFSDLFARLRSESGEPEAK